MSKTQTRSAITVWQAFLGLIDEGEGAGWFYGATTGQIAERSGMSRPTVRKYMNMARDEQRCYQRIFERGYPSWVRSDD